MGKKWQAWLVSFTYSREGIGNGGLSKKHQQIFAIKVNMNYFKKKCAEIWGLGPPDFEPERELNNPMGLNVNSMKKCDSNCGLSPTKSILQDSYIAARLWQLKLGC